MLTISPGVEGSDTYFARDNYYTKDQGVERSYWFGIGAELLGLGPGQTVNPERYLALWRGEVDGGRLGRVVNGEIKHRAGWDLTFSAPKSVSILAEVYGVEAVRQAHDKAVSHALAMAESMIRSRIRVAGQQMDLSTQNGVFACFTHDVNRNLDPQLHTHCFMLNMTSTPNGWRSINVDQIFRSQKRHILGREYRSALAKYLKEAGYDLSAHRSATLFEIVGVPDSLIKAFSSRSEQIEQWFEDRGIPYDSRVAKTVALITRKRKKTLTDDDKRAIWLAVADAHGFQREAALGLTLNGSREEGRGIGGDGSLVVREAVRKAIRHLGDRDMGFTLDQLAEEAARFSLGVGMASEIDKEILALTQRGQIQRSLDHSDPDNDHEYWSTQELKQLERGLLDTVLEAKGTVKAMVTEALFDKAFKKTHLNEQQVNAVRGAMLSEDRFFAIQGDPGVGKTTALREYRKLANKAGFDVIGLAPTYQAVAELSDSLNIQGMTVDRFLVDPKTRDLAKPFRKQVWLVDEASMPATEKIHELMTRANEQGARILFVGDHQQLETVGAGRGFHQLQRAGIAVSSLDKWVRPKNEYMNDVFRYAMGKKYRRLLIAMRGQGRVTTAKKERQLFGSMVKDWMALEKEERKNTLIVAPTNEQCGELNQAVREALRAEGTLAQAERSYRTFLDKHMTREEIKTASIYKMGNVVRFSSRHKVKQERGDVRIEANEYFTVVGVNPKTNRIALEAQGKKRVIYIDPSEVGGNRAGGIQVFERKEVKLSEGDKIRWLNNKNDHGLKRNTHLTVTRIGKESVSVMTDRGKRVQLKQSDLKNQHFMHDYASTAYGVQGATKTRVMAIMSSWRINTTHQRSMMVALTRATHDASLYTDNEEALIKALGRTGDNTEALTAPEYNRTIDSSRSRSDRRRALI